MFIPDWTIQEFIYHQQMPDEELLTILPVIRIISRPGVRVNCTLCGEEILNECEVWQGAAAGCQSCASLYDTPPRLFSSWFSRHPFGFAIRW